MSISALRQLRDWEGASLLFLGLAFSILGCDMFLKGYGQCGPFPGPMCSILKLSVYLFGKEQAVVPSVIGLLSFSGVLIFLGLRRLEKQA